MDQVRGDLLNELLKKKVTHSDIKRHNLTEAEMNVLYLADYIDHREFVYMYRRNHPDAHKKSGFKQWQRKRERLIRSFIGADCKISVDVCKYNGIDTAFVHDGYKSCLPVCKYYASYHGYSMDLLHARDDLYELTISLTKAAKTLGISYSQLMRLIQHKKLKLFNKAATRVPVYSIIDILQNQIEEKSKALASISAIHLEKLLHRIEDNL